MSKVNPATLPSFFSLQVSSQLLSLCQYCERLERHPGRGGKGFKWRNWSMLGPGNPSLCRGGRHSGPLGEWDNRVVGQQDSRLASELFPAHTQDSPMQSQVCDSCRCYGVSTSKWTTIHLQSFKPDSTTGRPEVQGPGAPGFPATVALCAWSEITVWSLAWWGWAHLAVLSLSCASLYNAARKGTWNLLLSATCFSVPLASLLV